MEESPPGAVADFVRLFLPVAPPPPQPSYYPYPGIPPCPPCHCACPVHSAVASNPYYPPLASGTSPAPASGLMPTTNHSSFYQPPYQIPTEEEEYEEEEEEASDESLHLEGELPAPCAPLLWAEEDELMIQIDHPRLMDCLRPLGSGDPDHEGGIRLALLWGYAVDSVTLQLLSLTPLDERSLPLSGTDWLEACQRLWQEMHQPRKGQDKAQIMGWAIMNYGDGCLPPTSLLETWKQIREKNAGQAEPAKNPAPENILLVVDIRQSVSQPALPCLEFYDLLQCELESSEGLLSSALAYTFRDSLDA